MTKDEAKKLLKSGAVERVALCRRRIKNTLDVLWEIRLDGAAIPSKVTREILLRGQVQTWASLDDAYGWIHRLSDQHVPLVIDD